MAAVVPAPTPTCRPEVVVVAVTVATTAAAPLVVTGFCWTVSTTCVEATIKLNFLKHIVLYKVFQNLR